MTINFRPTWIIIWLMALLSATAADWPIYRHDAQRSAATAEQLALPLKPAWSYLCAQPPAPAWPDTFPQALLNRMDFDYAPQLAIAEGIVCFGSSADDTVRALDAKTGREKWHFIAGGPVRFAPQIVSNRVYFASDDGYVYCLNAQTGRGIWKINLAPADERFVGNHRMISRWPVRTGVLVAGGVVYCAAGMWPAEGIFIYALRADTGQVLWCNDTAGGTPQGALLLGGDVLLIPNGNGKTTPLDRHTGKLMQWPSPHGRPGWVAGTYLKERYMGGSAGRGGTWVTIDGDKEYSFIMHRAGELAIESYVLTNGLAERVWWSGGAVPQLTIAEQWAPFQTHERGKASAIMNKGKLYARKAYGLALAGNNLFLGLDGAVSAQSATNASEIWRAEVQGEARDLAVADGRLFVSTSEGIIHCFAPGASRQEVDSTAVNSDKSPALGGSASGGKIALLLQQSGMDRGFALVVGDADGQISMALASQTQLRIINALTNAAQVAALRERLLATTAWHGSRIHVQHVARLDALPFAQYFANAVIVANQTTGLSGKELYRVLRPCGGILLLPGMEKAAADALILECDAYEAASHARSLQVATEPTPPSGHPSKEGISTKDSLQRLSRNKEGGLTNDPLQRLSRNKEGSLTNDPLQRRGGPDATRPQESRDDRDRGGFPFFVRGKLPGALDWDNVLQLEVKADQRVKWPLRLLWFGGPSTRQVQNDGEGAPGPVPANGRYFMQSERALTAVDAYNGTVLWSRPIPEAWPVIREVDGVLYRTSDSVQGRLDRARSLRVNNESVFLVLGGQFFQGKGEGTIQLDARTGEQQKIYGPFNAPTPVVSLKTAQTWPMPARSGYATGVAGGEANSNQSALVAMEATARGLVLTLTTEDQSVTPLDAWELYFDFRPVEVRYGLYERGAFHIRIVPAQDDPLASAEPLAKLGPSARPRPEAGKTPAAWRLITGPEHPKLNVAGTRDAAGTKTTVSLPWPELEKWIGVKPASFDFAATLNAHDGLPAEPIVRRHLFGNWAADGINNGWARIILNDAALATVGTNLPAIMVKNFKDVFNWGPGGYMSGNLDKSVLDAPGTHPLTGEPVPKIYGIAPVCGGANSSVNAISQAGGLYDLEDNSGRRSCYHGVKTGCTTPQMPALGMFIISEEDGHCVCNYPFRGSLALAPAERRLNEEWASFYDRDVDTRVRQAFVNLGAPGDRRDEKGNLWLGFPRNNNLQTPDEFPNPDHPLPYPLGMRDAQVGLWPRRPIRSALWLPLEVEVMTNFGPYRFSADRVSIKGADRPWIYGSGYRGIQKATLKLNFFKPLVSVPTSTVDKPDGRDGARPSTAAAAAITVDGKLDETLWADELRATNTAPLLPYTLTRVVFCHDSQNLYVGLQRPPMVYRPTRAEKSLRGGFIAESRPWVTTTNSTPDKISNRDNWWRLIVSDASPAPGGTGARKALYLTVTPTGTRADALRDPAGGGAGPAMRDAWQAGGVASAPTNSLNRAWNGLWQSAVQTNEQGWTLEMAIPWATLAEAGLDKNQLAVNFLMNDPGIGTEALTYLGMGGAEQCSNFTPLGLGKPAAVPTRAFTVRLHFAEPDETAKLGQRVFDVLVQGRQALTGFDIVKEAGGVRKAVVKEFPHVSAAEALTVEFKPRAAVPDSATAPILNGLELEDESWARPEL